jgi:hypothetical protein
MADDGSVAVEAGESRVVHPAEQTHLPVGVD